MENKNFTTSLQLKLNLLKSLKEGNLQQSQGLLEQLSQKSHTHPQLYQKFNSFIQQHKTQIQADKREQKEQENAPVIIDDDDSNASWVTDQSAQWSEEQQENIKEKCKSKPKMLKNVTNSKSAVCLKPIKEVKRPFYVQTKPKENITNSTINLRRESSQSKKSINISEMGAGLSKTGNLQKMGSKKSIKPYFPPISQSIKQNLKL